MAYMQNEQLAPGHGVEDEIGIARQRHDANIRPLRQDAAAAGKLSKQVDRFPQRTFDASAAAGFRSVK
jgi:hypothetical protein